MGLKINTPSGPVNLPGPGDPPPAPGIQINTPSGAVKLPSGKPWPPRPKAHPLPQVD
jgi:hypothetical protein